MIKWVLVFMCSLLPAEAALTLFVNPVDKTLKLSGMDSGIPQTNNGIDSSGATIELGQVRWELTGVGGPGSGSSSSSSLSYDENMLLSVGSAGHREVTIFSTVNNSGQGQIILRLFIDDPNFVNITGADTYQPAQIPDNIFARFVNANGQSLLPVAGTNLSAIQVIVVPEPSSSALLAMSLTCGLMRRSKRG